MTDILFYAFAALALAGAMGVVAGRNPVASLLSMVLCLGSIAVIYVLLEAHFLAAVQVIVYAGAIMVLFLFVIMLLNLGHDYTPDLRFTLWLIIPVAVSGALFGFLFRQLRGTDAPVATGVSSVDALVAQYGAIGAIARPLYTDWVVPFEITGILLLVAIVGALVLAKRRV
jgi:NADH-quinone oxidoreductase subunit J